ncbi:hypothetical protein [Telluribacter humicola]|uniref:hypothetical protein n=1 Tax=Telluribacter humicola TaxID=1720261 RepID=UPI001A9662A5|nr:hypothetical protein [Telluribacter humicola]
MKKVFLLSQLALVLGVFSFFIMSCQESGGEGSPLEPGGFGNNPRSKVPTELVGAYWHVGTFSMTNFTKYDGSYGGNANEVATGYRFVNDKGDAEQYFYWTKNSTYCRDQILGYRKGTVVFDIQKKTFTFYAASGYYRRYSSCGTSQSPGYGEKKIYGSEDLYPNYKAEYNNYEIVNENGKTIWRIRFEDNSKLDYMRTEEPK